MAQILTHKANEEEDEPFDILASAVTRALRVRLGRGQKRWGETVSGVLGDQALHAAAHVLTHTVVQYALYNVEGFYLTFVTQCSGCPS
jgi:hypothetical protein